MTNGLVVSNTYFVLDKIKAIISGDIPADWVIAMTPSRGDYSLQDRAYYAVIGASRPRAIKAWLHENLPDRGESLHERVYRAITGIVSPDCENGKKLKFDRLRLYGFCGTNACACFLSRKNAAIACRTNEQKKLTSEKRRATFSNRYGVENAMQVGAFFESARAKRNEQQIWNKVHDTMVALYGTTNGWDIPHIREKRASTNLLRYGAENPTSNADIARKVTDSWAKVDREALAESRRSSNLRKWGVDNPSKRAIASALAILEDSARLGSMLSKADNVILVAQELGVSRDTIMRYADKHGIAVVARSSSLEIVVERILLELGVNFIKNDRKAISPQEIDFLVGDIAIEVNGIYWHSSAHRDRSYHRNKHLACQAAGIRLLMLNEDEVIKREEAVGFLIKKILGCAERGVGARKLNIAQLHGEEKEFCERYHLQGAARSSIYAVGAFDGSELVGAMTFGYTRGTKQLELTRFCSGKTSHAGMFSKLFTHAIRENNWTEVTTFADLRYATGQLYEACGFQKQCELPPDYRYVRGGETFHKSTFQKKRLFEMFPDVSRNLTERQITDMKGIHRIYDCGKVKYVWSR